MIELQTSSLIEINLIACNKRMQMFIISHSVSVFVFTLIYSVQMEIEFQTKLSWLYAVKMK